MSSSGSDLTIAGHLVNNLASALAGTETTPIPPASVCAALVGTQGGATQAGVPGGARLLRVETPADEVLEAVSRSLVLAFGGTGMKLGKDLVLLTNELVWSSQGNAQVMVATFERGAFAGFFNSRAQHRRERVLFGVRGSELCVVPG